MKMKKKTQGYTLIEIIVFLVVSAIIVSIIYVSYNTITKRAETTAAQEDLSGLVKALRVYYLRNQMYPTDLTQIGYSNDKGTKYQTTISSGAYCITGTNGTTSYKISETNTTPQEGACAGHALHGQTLVVNMANNPNIETSTNNFGASRVNLARVTTWKAGGSYSVRLLPNNASNSDSFISLNGDTGGMRLGMQAGKTYTVSAKQYIPSKLTGELDSRAGKVQAYYKVGSGGYTGLTSDNGGSDAGERDVSRTFTLPAGTTEAFIRLYHGGRTGSGYVYYDNIMLTEGSTAHSYMDGNSSQWIWDGTPNLSTSRGVIP